MENNHLTYFKVENFKKFESLEVSDIGQFNLIVGDNNVGKTCLLEALLFDEDPQQLLNNFYLALTKRGFKFQIEEVTVKSNGISTTEIIKPKNNYFKEYIFGNYQNNFKLFFDKNKFNNNIEFSVHGNDVMFNYNEDEKIRAFDIYSYDVNILNFPLISFNDTPLEQESRNIYENLKTKREKQILINALKIVNPKIIDIELRENFDDLKSVFLISFEDKDEFIPLNHLGDGFKRIFYIVLKTISLRGKRIMIDEIEIGIHYTKLKDFWVNIIKICKELDVQLFATTHSDECVKDYVSALEIVECQDDARMIQLKQDTEGVEIYVTTYFYRHIKAGLDSNLKMLGA
jgi:AAA15 family ATPase/GTPase